MPDSLDFDLLVLGGGMAGISAATEAAVKGARVMVCEVADHLGGTAVLSTGNVWTVQTADAFRASDPDGDVALWQVVRDTLDDSLAWVESLGVPVRERHKASSSSTYDPPPIGRNVDIETFMMRGRRAVEAAGGIVLNGTTISNLVATDAGVEGARIVTVATGDEHEVGTRGVVLATGGFQASHDLRAEHLGQVVADSVAIRSNPHSCGLGLGLALEVGASHSRHMDTFYGVVLPAVPGEITEGDYRGLVLHAAVYGLVLGSDGTRLADESAGAVPLANAIARVGRALFVVSRSMVEAADGTLGVDLAQMLRASQVRGARFAAASSAINVASVATGWGYNGAAVLDTLRAYDVAITGGTDPAPPRRRHRHPLDGDLLVVEVQAAMTSTFGGVLTNTNGQALTADGIPVTGLYAAGVDQGGYNVSGYVGGLSRALTFGRRAAAHALLD